MESLSFEEVKNEVIKILSGLSQITLATSSNGRVTARTMSIVNDGLNIFCQTDKRFIKVEQIQSNPKVALSVENIQIEAKAEIKGHPFSDENKRFSELYRIKHKTSFDKYSSSENETVLLFIPEKITLWKYLEQKPCRDFLFPEKNEAFREFYT
jgi:general stress protein 26